tara:strand:+ start:651 stop:1502 length:852 start_codon:yes stop_codon:yes gene_type:complete
MHFSEYKDESNLRHVLGISGGKDSAALAIYIKDKYPDLSNKMEYFFTDTGAELKEIYDFLDRLEAHLDKEIIRLSSGKPFDHWLKVHNGYLPSPKQRWCTRVMKIKPFEKFIGNDAVISYVGIRADENREGYMSSKESVKAVFPFVEDGIIRQDVFDILERSVGVPEYYKWRSRSGCYFCFFQRQNEWLGLKRNHPELFEKAKAYEKSMGDESSHDAAKNGFTWSSKYSLEEIIERAEKAEEKRMQEEGIIATDKSREARWQEIIAQELDEEGDEEACNICRL